MSLKKTMVIKGNEVIDALYTILLAPTTFSPYCKLQSETKTLKHFGKLCSLCSHIHIHIAPSSSLGEL